VKKNNKKINSDFLGRVFLSLVNRRTLHQKYGEVLIYLMEESKGNNHFSVPVPNIIGKKIGMSFLRVRSALKEFEQIGAISISKKYSRSSILHITINYSFHIKETEGGEVS
jgi:hypothetical protein